MFEQVPHEVEHGDPTVMRDAARPVEHEDNIHLLRRVVTPVEPVDQLLACTSHCLSLTLTFVSVRVEEHCQQSRVVNYTISPSSEDLSY